MKFLVTGATGGLGSDLSKLLREKGQEVVALRSDVTDKMSVWDEVRAVSPNVVLHLAAIVGTKDCDEVPGQAIKTNVEGTYNVAHAAAKIGARVVYFSSSAIFLPPPLGGDFPLYEFSPTHAEGAIKRTIYGGTKLWGEQLCRKYVPASDLIVFRPCMGFANDRISQLAALIRSHWTRKPVNLLLDMKLHKDYCPIGNISHAVWLALSKDAWGETYNVGMDDPEPYQATIDNLRKNGLDPVYHSHPEYDFLGDHSVSVSKLRRELGYEPVMTRAEGVKLAIQSAVAEYGSI